MLGTALLVFREVLEASLIISVVCAAARGAPGRDRYVGGGIALGVFGALLLALFADAIGSAVSGIGQELFDAGVLLAAVIMIAWHAIWMASHGRELAARTRSLGSAVSSGSEPMTALLVVVAVAVLREGAESVLFIYAQAAGGAGWVGLASGVALGIVTGVAVGFALYFGLIRIPLRYFFSATNWLLLLVAAGMAAQAAHFLVQANVVPALGDRVWDTSEILSDRSLVGQALHALIGYDASPAGIQLVFYIATAVLIVIGMRLVNRAKPPLSRAAS
jgi:high-affinity iron transporter